MLLKKIATSFCCVFLLTAFVALGDTWDKRTVVTFSQPVEFPGIALSAGTYVLRLANLEADRNFVYVFNADENYLYGTILAVPNYRLHPADKTVLEFAERPANTPVAIRAWFYPGDNFGQEFVYPKTKAAALAKVTETPVLAAEVKPMEPIEELKEAPITLITPEEKELDIAEWVEADHSAEERYEVAAAPPAEPFTLPAPYEPIGELPKNAGKDVQEVLIEPGQQVGRGS